MKKIALFILINIYALSSFGIGIKQFYCCGHLKSTIIGFAQETKENCKTGIKQKGCCESRFHSFKVKDSHFAPAAINHTFISLSQAIILSPANNTVELVKQPGPIIHSRSGPPFYNGIPIYIFNCLYRI